MTLTYDPTFRVTPNNPADAARAARVERHLDWAYSRPIDEHNLFEFLGTLLSLAAFADQVARDVLYFAQNPAPLS